jgi:hypothetical protein
VWGATIEICKSNNNNDLHLSEYPGRFERFCPLPAGDRVRINEMNVLDEFQSGQPNHLVTVHVRFWSFPISVSLKGV